jgi:hypothetical protein
MVGEQNVARSSGSLPGLYMQSDSISLFQLASETTRTQTPVELGPPPVDPGPFDFDPPQFDNTVDETLNTGHPEHDNADARPPEQRESIRPDPLVRYSDTSEDPGGSIQLPKLETTQRFVDALRTVSLENSGMQPIDIENLRNPGPVLDLLDPSPLLRSLRHFINNASSSRAHYDGIREIELLNNPSEEFLSFDQVKRRLGWLSGVIPVEHDMCPQSCVAYTGPFNELEVCPRCSTTRYFPGTTKPRKRFTTLPIGPVIQSFYSSSDIADQMHYMERRLAANAEEARHNGGRLSKYNDTSCGEELLEAWNTGTLRKHDVALQLSIDGAQLRSDKPSEAWVFIWVVHNLPPELRYKKCYVIPGAIVPGPNKPEDIDSYLFPSLAHVAALQREGLKIYDASVNSYITQSSPVVLYATADSLGSAFMSGMVGHSGKFGCRLYCEMPSRNRKGDRHYYPAMQLPRNYTLAGSCHPDVNEANLVRYRSRLARKYKQNMEFLLSSSTQAEFYLRRLATGLCKQTLFSGLPRQPLPVPNVFTMDIMHLTTLNDPDLLIKLFTGKLNVYEPDDRSTWDWAVFLSNTTLWNAHGETVERAVPYLPSCFGRAPRNPAKKLNTGYKAWEYQQYIYGDK